MVEENDLTIETDLAVEDTVDPVDDTFQETTAGTTTGGMPVDKTRSMRSIRSSWKSSVGVSAQSSKESMGVQTVTWL